MNWLGLPKPLLRAFIETALPSLRVIGMAYTGLIGLGAAVLVLTVAFMPVTPALQEATQPAREAVGSLVQPAAQAVASMIVSSTVPRDSLLPRAPAPPAPVALARPASGLIVIPDVVEVPTEPVVVVPAPRPLVMRQPVAIAPLDVEIPEEVAVEEDVPADEPEPAVEVHVAVPIVRAHNVPAQQAAEVEPPRPLPTLPPAPEAAWQTKARLDAENQAAIDARKSSIERAKAEADAANQAAIDARKVVVVVAAPLHATSNQSLIDSAKAATIRTRAEANAANQAAIDAAKAPKRVATTAPTIVPTAVPAPATATPAPTATATATSAPEALKDEVESELDEMPITLATDEPGA